MSREVPPFLNTLDLLTRARGGDQESLRQVVERYRERILLRVRKLLGCQARRWADSGDFVHEVFVDFLRDFERFEPRDDQSLIRWLTAIARNTIRDELRRRREASIDSLLAAENREPRVLGRERSPPSEADRNDQIERIRTLLGRLSADHRHVVELRHFAGLSFAEIGRRLGRSENAVQLLHARALCRLGETEDPERSTTTPR